MDFTFGRILSFARSMYQLRRTRLRFPRLGSRDQETPFEAYLHRVGRDDLDLVLAAEIECGFTVHQLLARRMGLLLVLLGVLLLLINPLKFRLDDLPNRLFGGGLGGVNDHATIPLDSYRQLLSLR